GNVVYTVDGLVGNSGTFTTSVVSEASDPIGEYTLELLQDAALVDSVTFSIGGASTLPQATPTIVPTVPAPAGNVSITVPTTINLNEPFDIQVNGLTPNASVDVSIEYQNAPVFTT